ncbi:hypothetical protein [Candidatus Poriferisodalis sp.]|uniref:hypothetical protein n=1 Tax=Candidatus Poriferisodalis sp. TaxID=3101277 RepID=UPI003B5C974E
MSCLPPVADNDVVTKEFLRAELSRFATKDELTARFDAMRTEHAAQRDADRTEHATQFNSLRTESRHQFRWLVGIVTTMFGVLMAAMFALAAVS